ncbi:MAG: CoA transferase [Nitriliruptoraceae bacterium]
MPDEPVRYLAGIRVLDFTFQAAGAYAAMLLGSLGAQVIKVESASRPDPTRQRVNRPYIHSVFYEDVNLDKQAITINMKSPEGQELAKRLAGASHVVADCYRPGVMQKWGMGHADLRERYPHLVTASLTAAGQDGPYARLPGYAGIFNALSGAGNLTGYPDGPPTEFRTSMDMRAGALFAMAIAQGLLHAKRTGQGRSIDFSASEAGSTSVGDSIVEASVEGSDPGRRGNRDPRFAPSGVFACRDGWLALAVRSDEQWRQLVARLEQDGRPRPEGLETASARLADRDAAEAYVAAALESLDRAGAFELLSACGVPAGPVMDGGDLVADEHLAARGLFVRTPVTTSDTTRLVTSAPWVIDGRRPQPRPAPDLGAHTDAVLASVLGMSDSEIDALRTSGALS